MQALGSSAALRKAFYQAARPIAVIGAVGGFIGDIIQPLGNFALWIAGLSFVGAVIALIWLILLRRRAGEEIWDTLAGGLFVLCVGSFVIFTAWTIIFSVGPERGYLASNIEPIAQVQEQLLGLQKDVTEIKTTTGETATRVAEQGQVQQAQATTQAQSSQVQQAQATSQAESNQVQQAQATAQAQESSAQSAQATVQAAAATAQAQGFADLQSQFANLQKGSIIENPTTPQEWYSNARLYQLKGDTANAIQAYEGYFEYNLDYVDPYFEYSDLLKATDGIAHTREKIDALYNARKDSPTLDLAAARLMDDAAARVARLNDLAARAPQYGPVFYELGLEYDRELGASPTADLLQKQADAYGTVEKLEQDAQGYTRYYIDKSLAEKNLAQAEQRMDALANARNVTGKLDALVYQYNDGMQFIVVLTEAGVQKILFDIDNPKPTRETGMVSVGTTSVPNSTIGKIPLPVGEHTLYIQYIDANGTPSDVFSKEFVVRPVFATWNQQPLDFSTNTFPGTFLIGVTGAKFEDLYTYKWSIDSDALDGEVKGVGMATIPVTGLKAGEHTLYLQAVDAQGKASEVEQIPFEVK